MEIIEADIIDHNEITELTKLSKSFWGYSPEQIEKWDADLTITPDYISANKVFKLIFDGNIIGYYSYKRIDLNTIKLDNIFIQPEYIGKGYGKILMEDFFERIKKEEVENIILNSDPNAEGFYKKFGFKVTGKIESSIEGRFLPVMKLIL